MRDAYRRWLNLPGNVRGSLIVLVASLVSVVMTAFIKQVGQSIPVFEILFVRQILVAVIISPVLVKNFDSVLKTKALRLHLLRGALSMVAMTTGFTAVVYMPLAEVTAITFVRILFTTVLAMVILKEVVGIRRRASIIAGFVGVLVVVRPDAGNINVYALLAMLSAFMVSSNTILMRRLSQLDNPSTIMAYQSIFVTAGMAGPALYLWVTPSLDEAVLILLIGALMSVMQWLFIQAFKAGEAAAIAPMEYVRLIFAGVIGFVFFAEIPTAWTLTGAAIIIASTLYTMHRNAIKKRAP